ncbi:MAG: ketoacyl-ACP synthase III [Micrococcales bacterium]|nr:ketoacyl-ACP synthase III [Micrococcales bacterium]
MPSSSRQAVLAGWGAYAPPHVVTNADIERELDTTDAWITTRTGIRERRWADDSTSTGDLAVRAGRAALECAGVVDVDQVIVATTTPDHPCPATAPWVANELGLGGVPAHDVNAVCSGFLYALSGARDAILAGSADRVLVIGADRFTTLVNPTDRATRVLFGDGAGAAVLHVGGGTQGVLGDITLGSDGSNKDHIVVRAGGARLPLTGQTASADRYFAMAGQEVFHAAVTRMVEAARRALEVARWTTDDATWLVAHQANRRILSAVGRALNLPEDRVLLDVEHFGNTSAASIPMAISHNAHRFRAGDHLVLAAFGGGTTWGATTLTWPDVPGRLTHHITPRVEGVSDVLPQQQRS